MREDQSTVLLVEDEPLIRLFLSDLLEDSGFKVVEAANALEAMTILEGGRAIDVLLTDVDMPLGYTGFALARNVCKYWPHIGILIMSGRHLPARGELPPGAAFLSKPCPNEAILSHVQSAVLRTKQPGKPAGTSGEATAGGILPFPKTA